MRPDSPTLTFTGERRNEHFTVLIHGNGVQLSCAGLGLLIDLVLAGLESPHGYLQASPVEIHRLRQAIDAVVGPGEGKTLIETGSGMEYRLAIPREELRCEVAVLACFAELVERGVVTATSAEKLRAISTGGGVKSV